MATENLHYAPLYVRNDGIATVDDSEPRVWVVMRSRKEKVAVSVTVEGQVKTRTERLYGYERVQELVPEFFMPMKERVTTRCGRRLKTLSPAIPDIFFVNDTISHIDKLVAGDNGVEYLYVKGRPYRQPVIIRDVEMSNFIAATTARQRVIFHTAGDDKLSHLIGRKVRITIPGYPTNGKTQASKSAGAKSKGDGAKGNPTQAPTPTPARNTYSNSNVEPTIIEGELLTVRGSRTRRLRVSLPSSLTTLIAYIDLTLPPDALIETLD